MHRYTEIPDGQCAVITYPNMKAMIFGISQVTQDNKGNICVIGANGDKWDLGNIGIDIQAEYQSEAENALLTKLMPLCK